MNTATRPAIGSKVGVDDPKFPGVWIVKSHGPKNATLQPENGGRGLRAPYYLLTDAPVALADGTTLTEVVPVPEFYKPGELLRIDEGGHYAGLYVVIADKGTDKVNLAKLGGDNGRYLRASRRGLVRVSPSKALRELTER